MVFPMISIEIPPTEYTLRMRPVFTALLVILFILAIGKFVISDMWGAISMLLVCLMGCLVLTGNGGINVTNCLFYSVMALISGIFDVMACVMYLNNSKYKLFDGKAPTMVLVAQSIFVLSPLCLFISAGVAYSMYSDARNNAESQPLAGDWERGGGYYDAPPPARSQPAPKAAPTQPFQGQGQRLGSN